MKYQWKPPKCSHRKTFGHSTVACKIRPGTDEEIATTVLKDVLKVNKAKSYMVSDEKSDNEVFIAIGKKNKPVRVQSNAKQSSNQYRNVSNAFQNRGFQSVGRSNAGNGDLNFGNKGPYQQDINVGGGSKNQSNVMKSKGFGGSVNNVQRGNMKSVPEAMPSHKKVDKKYDDKSGMEFKPSLNSKYSANYQPKVLVRGSGSSMPTKDLCENVPVKNPFQVLNDQDMVDKDDCFIKSVVWPKLQSEVEEVMRSGVPF